MSRKVRVVQPTRRITPARIAWLAGGALLLPVLAGIWFSNQPPAASGHGKQQSADLTTLPPGLILVAPEA